MTATLTLLEARCTRCWNSNCFPVELAGSPQPCRHCGHEFQVPDATPERIARATALVEENPDLIDSLIGKSASSQPSVVEATVVTAAVRGEKTDHTDFCGYPPASITARFIAYTIDQILLLVATAVGVVTLVAMMKNGLIPKPSNSSRSADLSAMTNLLMIGILPVMVCACQWILLATSGQTLGKKLMLIRVVNMQGKLPGFFSAVVLRSWLRAVLYCFPFVWLIDYLFIFGESKRAGHDWISGTQVIAQA